MTLVRLVVTNDESWYDAELPPEGFQQDVPWREWMRQASGPHAFIETTGGQVIQLQYVVRAFEPA